MNFILYYIFLLPLSYLPFGVLYVISDALNFILFNVIGYRKKVIEQNINNSFPELSEKEKKDIAKKFQSHFCDLLVESIKTFSISEKDAFNRLHCKNPEVVNHFFEQGRHVVMVGGHYNNWELYAVALKNHLKHQPFAIYKSLSNNFFDEKMRETRSKHGLNLISMKLTKKYFEEIEDVPRGIIFVSDQSPSNPKKAYWTTFLNQETGVQFGVEKYAKEFNWPVIYGELRKIKRGFYEVEYYVVCENPNEFAYGKITELHTQLLEQTIKKAPQYWLWTHKRWKHKRPENV
ncbi:MAG: lysophospholipid acyltransferase family protein [Bacteroidia bacterium]